MKISSLALFCITGCLVLTSCQSNPPRQYAIGPSYFPDGDLIILEDVHSSLGTFEQGDTVIIKGKYKLEGKQEAKLLLTISQTEGDGHSIVQPEQMTIIQGKSGDFTLSININYRGYLHLSLRTASGKDRSFGSLYFGTPEQMQKVSI